jgi:hypothetical protein
MTIGSQPETGEFETLQFASGTIPGVLQRAVRAG